MIGVAMNIDENVPAMMPMSIVSAKSKIEPSPKQKSASTAKSVVTEVITVRESVAFTERSHSSLNGVFWSLRRSSRMRSNTTIVSFTE